MVVIVLIVLILNSASGSPGHSIPVLFAVALAVGLSPELLPAIVSVTLSAGARAMGSGALRPPPGSRSKISAAWIFFAPTRRGRWPRAPSSSMMRWMRETGHRDEVRKLAFFNAAFEAGIENPLDAAIVAAGRGKGLTTDGFAKIDEIPYNFFVAVSPSSWPKTAIRRSISIVPRRLPKRARHLLFTRTRLRRYAAHGRLRQNSMRSFKPKEPRGSGSSRWRHEGRSQAALRTRRRTGHDFPRVSGLLRPAQAGGSANDPGSCPVRHPHQGNQWRQSLPSRLI